MRPFGTRAYPDQPFSTRSDRRDKLRGGKDQFTLGLLSTLKVRGLDVQAFKAGPDYIDPRCTGQSPLVRPAISMPGSCGRAPSVRSSSANAGWADLSLVEGVMGYYDGAGPGDGRGSTASVARILRRLSS